MQFVWLQELLNPQADLRKAFGDVTERLIHFVLPAENWRAFHCISGPKAHLMT